MRIKRRGLKKEDIAGVKGYMRWYRVIEDELRLFIREDHYCEKNEEIVNRVDFKNNIGYTRIADVEGGRKFYDDHKHLKLAYFLRCDSGTLYNEYEVKNWYYDDKDLVVEFVE